MTHIPFCEAHVKLSTRTVTVRRWHATASSAEHPPFVLFHESLGCITMWRDFPARLALATGRAVIAYDRIGYGRSTPSTQHPHRSYIRDEAHAVVRPLLDALEIDRFIGFGHSTGGSIALAAAAQLDDRCAGVISESGHSFVETCTLRGIEAARQRFQDPTEFRRLERHHGGRAHWVLDSWIETWLAPWFKDWNLDEFLVRIDCPILLLQGAKDCYGTLQQAHRISGLAKASTTVTLMEGCAHTPHLEDAEGTISHAQSFIGRMLD